MLLNPDSNQENRYPLDDAAISTIAELREGMRPYTTAINAVVLYFARAHGLRGECSLSEDGRELILRNRAGENNARKLEGLVGTGSAANRTTFDPHL